MTPGNHHRNNVTVTLTVSSLNTNDLTVNIKSSINALRLDRTHMGYPYMEAINLGADQFRNDTNFFNIVLDTDNQNYNIINVTNKRDNSGYPIPVEHSFSLLGDPTAFPFDSYAVRLILAIPMNDVSVTPEIKYGKLIYASWYPSWSSSLVNGIAKTAYLIGDCEKLHEDNPNDTHLPEHLLCPSNSHVLNDHNTILLIQLGFTRNSSVIFLIISILGLFFLLGGAFLLDRDQLTNRMAITFGVAAIILAFTTIIDNIKPLHSLYVATIADLLVNLLIISTILFTVSSVIGSSEAIRETFGRDWVWIDRICFLIVGWFATFYMANSPDIKIYLIPFAIFGLGYGILIIPRKKRKESSSKQSELD